MSNTLTETAEFIQHHLPGLDAGEYALDVKHAFASDNDPNQIPTGADVTDLLLYKFGVGGSRFRMDPGMVHSTFPPTGSIGEYSNVLPHVVLTSKTLPWSLTPVAPGDSNTVNIGSFKANDQTAYDLDVPSWLAVLIFTEQDFAAYVAKGFELKITNTTTASFFGSGNFISPASGEDINNQPPWINATDACQAIRIPIELFSSIAPSMADLFMLASVRKVDMTNKPAQAVTDTMDAGTYSIVMGNRIPVARQRHLGILVSLENMQSYLPDQNGVPSTNIPSAVQYAYLPVLANWNFISDGDSYRFDHLLMGLNGRSSGNSSGTLPDARLKMYPPNSTTLPADGATASIDMGYIPLKHTTRNSAVTASWYRGPFIPYTPAADANKAINIFNTDGTPAIYDADALVRLDPTTGLFDLSYASAWQLGRLLALQDKSFSTLLYQWKRQQATNAVQAFEELIINSQFHQLLEGWQGQINARKDLLFAALNQLVNRNNRIKCLKV